MKRFVVLTLVLLVSLLVGTQQYPLGGTIAGGGTAPGVAGSTINEEGLAWVHGLERVPFPGRIDSGQWTDYYWSPTAAGAWAQGDDANDGLTPETAVQTFSAATALLFGGGYRRVTLDDDCTVGNSCYDASAGVILDAAVTIGTCPQSDFLVAHEQPCFWLRSLPGSNVTIDGTGAGDGPTLDLATITKRAHLLIEDINITGEDFTAVGVGSPPIDTHEAGIITFIGGDLVYSGDPAGTGNVASAHDVSVTHVYGDVNMSFTGTPSAVGNPMFGANVSGSMAVHSANSFTGCSQCAGFNLNQLTGDPDTSLNAEALVTPASLLVTGVRFTALAANATGHELSVLRTQSGDDRSNQTFYALIGTTLEENGGGFGKATVGLNISDHSDNADSEIHLINNTWKITSSTNRHIQITNATRGTTAISDIYMAGNIFEVSGDQAVAQAQILRFQDVDWAGSASTLRMVDTIYDDYDGQSWRIDAASGNCLSATAAALETCLAGETVVATVDVDNNAIANTPDDSGTATGGAATTITDTGQTWTVNEWAGAVVALVSGTGSDQTRKVASNTATALTVTVAWDVAPAAGTGYELEHFADSRGLCAVGGECDDQVSAAYIDSDYTVNFPERVQIPSFITGRRVVGYKGTAATDAGRLRSEPWAGTF